MIICSEFITHVSADNVDDVVVLSVLGACSHLGFEALDAEKTDYVTRFWIGLNQMVTERISLFVVDA